MESYKLKVLIAEDHSMFRLGLSMVLKEMEVIGVIREVKDGQEALNMLQSSTFDLLFLDLEMPVKGGIEVLQEMRLLQSPPKTIIISMHNNKHQIINAYRLGVSGFILKNTELKELENAVKLIIEGEKYFSKSIRAIIYEHFIDNDILKKNNSFKKNTLTKQEEKILKYICEQLNTEEIAAKLNVSPLTIKRHRQNIMIKTESENLVGMVLFALKNGIFSMPE